MFVSALAEERNRGRIGDFLLNDVMESLIQPLKLPLVFLAALVPCGHGCMDSGTGPRIPAYLPASALREPQTLVE
jgi:hypothetical protein